MDSQSQRSRSCGCRYTGTRSSRLAAPLPAASSPCTSSASAWRTASRAWHKEARSGEVELWWGYWGVQSRLE